jgi:hypothetical protein
MEHRLPTPIASPCAAGRARVGVRRFPDRTRRALPLGLLLAVAFATEVGAVRSIVDGAQSGATWH